MGSGIQKAEILSAAPLETTEAVALNIVLVVDNSFSMKERRAAKPLLTAMDEFFKTVRPIDNIHLVVFDDHPAMKVEQYALHTSTINSSDVSKLQNFLRESLEQRSTGKTFLYEAMAAGVEIVRRMPAQDNKFMVVFSDGEDLNSSVSTAFIEEQAKGINNFEAFCVDYMPGARLNRFLTSFAATHDGRIWKATSAAELLPIFQAFTTALRYRYVVVYRMLDPIIAEPAALNIDMLTMVDGSPLSNYVFFETGKSEIPLDYVLIKDPVEAVSFDPNSLSTAPDRYLNVLNLVGQKLAGDSTARVKIVGCNSDSGIETANLDLSERRAASVMSYLQEVWGIDASRMDIETRNLPANATAMDLVGARPENQRVEIYSDFPALLDIVKSTYVQEISDAKQFIIQPQINSGYQIDHWTLKLAGDGMTFESLSGSEVIEPAYHLSLADVGLRKLSTYRTITAGIEVTDRKGQSTIAQAQADVRFIRRQERLAQKEGYRVLEKYALILFDFNRSDIKEHNKDIIDRIVARIKEIPTATVNIVGHTDTIGHEAYNLDLSTKRAKSAYDFILAGGVPAGDNLNYKGIGPQDALFDNELPEGRALNRTVTVTLEYAQKE